jgi:hypothetical protein
MHTVPDGGSPRFALKVTREGWPEYALVVEPEEPKPPRIRPTRDTGPRPRLSLTCHRDGENCRCTLAFSGPSPLVEVSFVLDSAPEEVRRDLGHGILVRYRSLIPRRGPRPRWLFTPPDRGHPMVVTGTNGGTRDNLVELTKRCLGGIGAWAPDFIVSHEFVFIPDAAAYTSVEDWSTSSSDAEMAGTWLAEPGRYRVNATRIGRDQFGLTFADGSTVVLHSRDIPWDPDL